MGSRPRGLSLCLPPRCQGKVRWDFTTTYLHSEKVNGTSAYIYAKGKSPTRYAYTHPIYAYTLNLAFLLPTHPLFSCWTNLGIGVPSADSSQASDLCFSHSLSGLRHSVFSKEFYIHLNKFVSILATTMMIVWVGLEFYIDPSRGEFRGACLLRVLLVIWKLVYRLFTLVGWATGIVT